jgi:exopolysaccharide biosynthesis polyprenyl glycosylphosphotransferase
MTQPRRKALLELGVCVDLLICAVSLLAATAATSHIPWRTDTFLIRHPLRQMLLTLSLSLLWHLSMVATGAYRSYRLSRLRAQAKVLAGGTALAAIASFVWLFAKRWSEGSTLGSLLLTTLLFWVFAFSGLLIMRIGARAFARLFQRRSRHLRNVLIIGSNRRAIALADSFGEGGESGYHVIGFADDVWHFDGAADHYKKMLLGSSGDTLQLLRNLALDEVIITLPIASSYQRTRQIIDWCRKQGIPVRGEASLFDTAGLKHAKAEVPVHLITLYDGTPSEWTAGAKRLVDLLVSACALILLIPIFACIAIAIKLTSKGDVFFSQERLGIGKRRFQIFKFRTMVTNAEALMASIEHLNQSKGPTFKLKGDPRITPVGAFLRKASLDELPQLFNVFLGDMSLVGPRPLPIRDYHGFSEDWHRRRFSIKPGITCLWQVSGRSSIGFERWMELDMDYIDRWSLWLDFKILMQTIPAIVRGSGAM